MPTKANYQLFEQNPDLEFDHYLCERLGWRSVELMRQHMSAAEWARWAMFYRRKGQRQEHELMKAKAKGG